MSEEKYQWNRVETEPYLDVILIKEVVSGKQIAHCHDLEDAEYIANRINRYNHDRQIISIWSIDDVRQQAALKEIDITDEQAFKVLHNIERTLDASIGINWDVIDCHLDMLETTI